MNNINTKQSNGYNFIKQFGIFAGVTVVFALLVIGSRVISWSVGSADQMFLLVNIMMGLGFIVYLRSSGQLLDPNPRIKDKAALYWVCLWISLILISSFYRADIGWANNLPANLWLLIETLFIAVADETVFRAFGDFCFPQKSTREEAAMVICYGAFYCYAFIGGIREGITAVVLAIGIGTLFTGLYLRYHKLGANIAYHFVLIFLMRMTGINSTADKVILGSAAPFIFAIGVAGMVWYGVKLIKIYHEDGVFDDAKALAGTGSPDPIRVFSESRDKYKEKVMTKAEPKIEKSAERYRNKLEARAAKQEEKAKQKEERKNNK